MAVLSWSSGTGKVDSAVRVGTGMMGKAVQDRRMGLGTRGGLISLRVRHGCVILGVDGERRCLRDPIGVSELLCASGLIDVSGGNGVCHITLNGAGGRRHHDVGVPRLGLGRGPIVGWFGGPI